MNRKAWSLVLWAIVVCVVVAGTLAFLLRKIDNVRSASLRVVEMTKLRAASERASWAYKHETGPAAIKAMLSYVELLEEARHKSNYAFVVTEDIAKRDLIYAQVRLSKLYASTGQTNLSATALARAIEYVRQLPANFQELTNQTKLYEFVDRLDQNIK